jgi:hypothetical protein
MGEAGMVGKGLASGLGDDGGECTENLINGGQLSFKEAEEALGGKVTRQQ